MCEIDASGWKAFRVGDLFEVALPKGDIQPNFVSDGDTRLVSAVNVDNGVTAMISHNGDGVSEMFSGGCITVNMFGTAFWQPEPFYAVSHGRINVLQPKCAFGELAGLFVVSALNEVMRGEYDYTNMCTRSRVMDVVVHLPATSNGEPDWAYMEQYMSEVLGREEVFAEHLASLTAEAVSDGHVIDTSAWKKFRVIKDLGFSCHHGSRLNKHVRTEGNLPFVTAGFENQGVAQFVGNDLMIYRDAITVDMFGNCFYHDGDCSGDDNVYFFVNNDVLAHEKLFVVSAINAATQCHFDYSRQFRQGDADDLSVLLPTTSSGEPNWNYMERYMRDVMEREDAYAQVLELLVA